MNCYNAAGHIYNTHTHVAALQKGGFSLCERPCFTMRKAVFCIPKDRLSQSKHKPTVLLAYSF